MKRSLVVVESPTKVKTIQKYLDASFVVKASMGHVRDLPKSQLGVDPKRGFKPRYVISPSKKKVLDELKKAAEKSEALYVATDPDREGEAIGWHLAQELPVNKRKVYRITFNEITERAVKAAFLHPGKIDLKKVDAQQARRVLDRLVGYNLRRSCGTRSSAGSPPAACSRWPSASSSIASGRSRPSARRSTGRSTRASWASVPRSSPPPSGRWTVRRPRCPTRPPRAVSWSGWRARATSSAR